MAVALRLFECAFWGISASSVNCRIGGTVFALRATPHQTHREANSGTALRDTGNNAHGEIDECWSVYAFQVIR